MTVLRKRRLNNLEALNDLRDIGREMNVLTSTVGPNGPAIIRDIENMGEVTMAQAVEAELELDKIVRGDASLLENQDSPVIRETIQKLRATAHASDEANEAWQKNKYKFMNEVIERSNKLLPEGSPEKTRAALEGAKKYRNARVATKVSLQEKRSRVMEHIETDPTETIFVPERHYTTRSGREVPDPYDVNINGVLWRLGFGEQKVPAIIARRWREMQREEEMNENRRAIMKKNQDYITVRNSLKQLGRA